MKVFVAALTCVLAAGLVFAQQSGYQGSGGTTGGTMQGSQQGMGSTAGLGSHIQQLSQQVQQNKFQLERAIQTAERQVRGGKAIGAAFVMHGQAAGGTSGQPSGQTGGTAGQPGQGAGGSMGQDQNVVAHVYVFADNQIRDVVVDPKANKVQDTQNRQTLGNPWLQSQMGMGGTSGADGQADRPAAAMGGQLTLTQAQQISRQADQQNASLDKAIDKAKDQVQNGQVIGAFLVLHQGQQTGAQQQQQQQQSGQQGTLVSKVYVVDTNNQLRVVTLDAKADRVQNVETQQSLIISPWRTGAGMGGTGGSGWQQQQQQQQREGSQDSEQFPTGSGSGSGAGSLGGSSGSGSGSSSGQQSGGSSGY